MIRILKITAATMGAIVVVGLGSILLFWLGRPVAEQQRAELVVDPEIDSDDAGTDVDELR